MIEYLSDKGNQMFIGFLFVLFLMLGYFALALSTEGDEDFEPETPKPAPNQNP